MISVTIIVKNGAQHLQKALQALAAFPEVIVVDTGSTDTSKEIATSFANVKLYERPFTGFGPTHNIASSLATNDWILSIDADEIATPDLINEILSLQLDDKTVYRIPRHNYFRGKFIKGCGWYPDDPIRLYNRRITQFNDAEVHESVLASGLKVVTLQHPLNHFPYETISDFLAKMQSYSTLFALQYRGKKRSSLPTALAHALFAFFRSYFLKRGLLLGQEGFIISLYNAHTAYYKYLKLAEANKKCSIIKTGT